MKPHVYPWPAVLGALLGAVFLVRAQTGAPARVDFARDIIPGEHRPHAHLEEFSLIGSAGYARRDKPDADQPSHNNPRLAAILPAKAGS
ncbi:MAG: hypothetical protein ACREUU_04115 [Gammaproteobacteria bacterium]